MAPRICDQSVGGNERSSCVSQSLSITRSSPAVSMFRKDIGEVEEEDEKTAAIR